MEKINYAIACDNVTVGDDGKVSIIGIFDVIKILKKPGLIPILNVFINLSLDIGKEYTIKTAVDLDNKNLTEIETGIPKAKTVNNNVIHTFQFFTIPKEGVINFRISINGDVQLEKHMSVIYEPTK